VKKNNQSGSIHIIIISVLSIALIGTLGFVFWQNFVNKPATSVTTSDTTDSKTSSPSSLATKYSLYNAPKSLIDATNLNFSVEHPDSWIVDDTSTGSVGAPTVAFTKNKVAHAGVRTSPCVLVYASIGSFADSAAEYAAEQDSNNKPEVQSSENVTINQLPGVKRTLIARGETSTTTELTLKGKIETANGQKAGQSSGAFYTLSSCQGTDQSEVDHIFNSFKEL
jgi:hypothetical protein